MTVGDRIKQRRLELGISQPKLAKSCGWKWQTRIVHYEKERRHVSAEDAKLLAAALNTTPAWILFGIDDGRKDVSVIVSTAPQEIPLITWEKILESNYKRFLLKIENDSMTSQIAAQTTFKIGDIITVDAMRKVSAGDYVIVKLGDGSIIFRQYIQEGKQKILKPINTQYPLIIMDNKTEILGVVVKVESKFINE